MRTSSSIGNILELNFNPNGCTQSRLRLNNGGTAKQLCALDYADEAKPSVPQIRTRVRGLKSFSVVAHGEYDSMLLAMHHHAGLARLRVFDNVVHSFLHHPVEIDLRDFGKNVIDVIDGGVKYDRGGCRGSPGYGSNCLGQSDAVQLVGAQIVRNLFYFPESLGRFINNLLNISICWAALAITGIQENRCKIFDDDKPLPQAVVKFGGNSLTLAFLRCNQLARKCLLRRMRPFDLSHTVLPYQYHQGCRGQCQQGNEPPTEVKRSGYENVQLAALHVPHTAAVAGDHAEIIVSRR